MKLNLKRLLSEKPAVKEILVGSAFLTTGHFIYSVVAMAANLLMARYLGPSEFGWYAILMAETSLVFSLVTVRVNTLIIRATEEELTDHAKDTYFSVAVYETVLATLLALAWMSLSGHGGTMEYVIVFALAVRHWMDINKAFYERHMPYKILAVVETLANVTAQVVAVLMVVMGYGVSSLVAREVVLTSVGLAGLWFVGGVTVRKLKRLSTGDLLKLMKQSRAIWLDNFLQGTFQRLLILVAGYVGGAAVAGYFFQALRLAGIPHQFMSPLVNRVIFTWFARYEDTDKRLAARNNILLGIFFPLLGVALMFAVFSDSIISVLLGENWSEVAPILVGLSGFIVFVTPFEVLRSFAIVGHQTGKINAARVVQHIALLLPILAISILGVSVPDALSVGLSAAYALAFCFLYELLRRS